MQNGPEHCADRIDDGLCDIGDFGIQRRSLKALTKTADLRYLKPDQKINGGDERDWHNDQSDFAPGCTKAIFGVKQRDQNSANQHGNDNTVFMAEDGDESGEPRTNERKPTAAIKIDQ